MPSLLSPRAVAQIRRLRRDAFATGRALADPQTDLVLNRDGIELDVQEVLIDWVSRRDSQRVGVQAMREIQADVVFRRPEPFDVATGDRFRVHGHTGAISRVIVTNGMVYAEATLDVAGVS